MSIGPECEISSEEPHHVVAADPDVGLAALVQTVSEQETASEMADRHLGDVVDDHRLQVGERNIGEQPTTRLDLAGDGELIPEPSSHAVAQEHTLLIDVDHPDAGEQRRVGTEDVPAPVA